MHICTCTRWRGVGGWFSPNPNCWSWGLSGEPFPLQGVLKNGCMGTVPASRAAVWQKISITLTLPTFPSTVRDSIQNLNLHWLIRKPKSRVAKSCHSRIMSHYRDTTESVWDTTQPQRTQYTREKVYYSFTLPQHPGCHLKLSCLRWSFAFVLSSFPPQ